MPEFQVHQMHACYHGNELYSAVIELLIEIINRGRRNGESPFF